MEWGQIAHLWFHKSTDGEEPYLRARTIALFTPGPDSDDESLHLELMT